MQHITRRQALRLAALAIVGSVAAACGPAQATPASRPTAEAPGGSPAPSGQATAAPAPRTAPLGGGPTVSITPNNEFFSLDISTRYDWFKAGDFTLKVSGAVDHPLTLTMGDLQSLPAVEQMQTLECISNPPGGSMIGNAMWKGARLADVLTLAGLSPAAVEIKMTAADGYHTSIPVSLAMNPDSLLAYEMNGVPLPEKHGAPLRCLFPGRYGTKEPKWITGIEAVTQPYVGYWERQGWSNDAIVKVNSGIVTPETNETISAATYPISGIVFSNESGVRKLEVSTDGGQTWHDAALVRGPTPLAWSEWRYDWPTPESGAYVVIARATDNDGNQQPVAGSRLQVPDSGLDGTWTAAHTTAVVKK